MKLLLYICNLCINHYVKTCKTPGVPSNIYVGIRKGIASMQKRIYMDFDFCR